MNTEHMSPLAGCMAVLITALVMFGRLKEAAKGVKSQVSLKCQQEHQALIKLVQHPVVVPPPFAFV